MQLTPNFSLEEFCHSQRADDWDIDNMAPEELIPVCRYTCEGLERIRAYLGDKPITLLSGFRTSSLNSLIGGAKNSQHMRGEAADFKCPAFGSPLTTAMFLEKQMVLLGIDQLILEYGRWVHVSFTKTPRHQSLTYTSAGVKSGIVSG